MAGRSGAEGNGVDMMLLGSWSVNAELAAYDDHEYGRRCQAVAAHPQGMGRMGRAIASVLQ
jgi:hypothetical protein